METTLLSDVIVAALRRLLERVVIEAADRREIGIVEAVGAPEPGAVPIGLPPRVSISLQHLEALAALADLPNGVRDTVASLWERDRAGLH